MPHRVQLKAVYLALVSALALGAAGIACAQQDQNNGGPALPGPSLDDAPPPPPSAAPPVTPAPVSPTPSSAAPAPTTSAAPAPAASQPPAQVNAPAAQPRTAPVVERPAVDDDAPWYEKAWGSVTGWFSGIGSKLSSPSEPKAAPPASAPAAAASSPATDAAARAREGFAADSPERTIRTGMGKCLKTGTWAPGQGDAECPTGAAGEGKRADAVAAAKPVAPKAEPVEVKPLDASAEKVAKPLEPEAPKAPEPAPAPAPAPAAAPAKPEVMTLSADALFAIGKADLKPNARQGLDELVSRLGQMNFESIKIVGHTDPTGAAAANDRLSVRRADAVKRYLVAKGVAANKIKTEGQGSRKPVVAQKDCAKLAKAKKAACYQPDRRVEIEVNGATKRAGAK